MNRDRGGASAGGCPFTPAAGLLTVIALALGGAAQASAQQSATALMFDGVTVVDVEQGTLVPNQRVVITGNRIGAIGPAKAVSAPKHATIVDARGKYLMPGLWDLHTHPRRYTDFFYPLFIAHGVTGIRDAGSDVPLDTLSAWRRQILAGALVGPPRQLLSGQSIVQKDDCVRRKQIQTQTCVTDTADARHLVDSLVAAGADIIKSYGPPKAIFFVIAREARRLGVPVGGHVDPDDLLAAEASDSGIGILDHLNSSGGLGKLCMKGGEEGCRPVAERLARNNTWLVPTLIRFADVRRSWGNGSQAVFDHFSDVIRRFWADSTPRGDWLRTAAGAAAPAAAPGGSGIMKVAQNVGLPVLAGTDVGSPVLRTMPPGFALHAELAMYVAEGMTPLRALQTATINPAKFLHATDSLGTVAAGKLADLVLLDANPLADITNTTTIRAVVADGRYYNRAALDKLLADVRTAGLTEPEPLGTARSDE